MNRAKSTASRTLAPLSLRWLPLTIDPHTPARTRFAAATIRRPAPRDAARITALAHSLPNLDRYAGYLYVLLCDHFAATCGIAELEGLAVGFVTGYRLPEAPETLFVWQVGVTPDMHGTGVATRLLADLLARPENAGVHFVETTVSPDNQASRRLFLGFAKRRQAPLIELPGYASSLFPGVHPPEPLLRIGPISRRSS